MGRFSPVKVDVATDRDDRLLVVAAALMALLPGIVRLLNR